MEDRGLIGGEGGGGDLVKCAVDYGFCAAERYGMPIMQH